MGQDTIQHYEIQDTGMEVKDGPVVYPRVQEDYIKVYGRSFSPQLSYMVPEYNSPLKDRVNQKWDFTSKRIVGKNPPTFSITLVFKKDKFPEFKKILQLADNYGLKKLKGGIGLIENFPFANESGEIYFIISNISPSESVSAGVNIIAVTISGTIV